ncbi:MAG: drug/metabolite transporter (DMT)-like permease [Verrucomicrobiales bacterium]|jgi:drug/metabolite transporter (DMT)-like permease
MALALALISIFLMTISQLVFKAASNRVSAPETATCTKQRGSFIAMISQPQVIMALGLNGCAAICWLLALSQLDLSYAAPLLSLNYLLVPLGAYFLFREKISRQRILAILVICSGVLICLFSSGQ